MQDMLRAVDPLPHALRFLWTALQPTTARAFAAADVVRVYPGKRPINPGACETVRKPTVLYGIRRLTDPSFELRLPEGNPSAWRQCSAQRVSQHPRLGHELNVFIRLYTNSVCVLGWARFDHPVHLGPAHLCGCEDRRQAPGRSEKPPETNQVCAREHLEEVAGSKGVHCDVEHHLQ